MSMMRAHGNWVDSLATILLRLLPGYVLLALVVVVYVMFGCTSFSVTRNMQILIDVTSSHPPLACYEPYIH